MGPLGFVVAFLLGVLLGAAGVFLLVVVASVLPLSFVSTTTNNKNNNNNNNKKKKKKKVVVDEGTREEEHNKVTAAAVITGPGMILFTRAPQSIYLLSYETIFLNYLKIFIYLFG